MKKIIFSILILLFSYSYFIEPNILTIKKINLRAENFAENITPIKMVQLSDLHFGAGTSLTKINKIYETAKNLEPNLIFITGDIVGDKKGAEAAAVLVKKLSADCPVYMVFGNWDNEIFGNNINQLKQELEESGAKVLINENENIFIGGLPLTIFGVKKSLRGKTAETKKNLEQTLQGASDAIQNYKILLAHSPEIVEQPLTQKFDLILTGHTHGGQIYLPFLTKMIIPIKSSAKRFIKGLYPIGEKTMLYVNQGIGTSMLPLRFLTPPEITIFELSSG